MGTSDINMIKALFCMAAAGSIFAGPPAFAQQSSGSPPASAAAVTQAPLIFTRTEVMVPMRDGIRLQTVILTPPGTHGRLPIILRRTPYGAPDTGLLPDSLKALAADGYIFVVQNIRGRFGSEGRLTLAEDMRVEPGQGTIETRDGWDTVDWLIKHVPNNNGRVGIYGVSYDGYMAGATLLNPHPALKAVSEQASPADEWMNDDEHHYGALRLSYTFEYAVLEEAEKEANTHFAFDTWDTYDWYLRAGPISSLNDNVLRHKIDSWNQTALHPNYDAFWRGQAWTDALDHASVPNLNVAGFWDQEDPWGPWQIFDQSAKHDPHHINLMVAGPWAHGAWRRSASTLGPFPLGEDTARTFRETIEAPYFAYWLHDKGIKPDWTTKTFQTGSDEWKSYAVWPPMHAKAISLFLHADGTLSFTPPGAAEQGAHRSYVSDPANPVPYRAQPISPTYPGGDWPNWESTDQRFVDHRPDVISYSSAPLDHDLIVTGEVVGELFASTSGTDADMVLKLIDVAPEDGQPPRWSPEQGPAPGQYAKSENGYELPIAMEVRRGRFLVDPAHPKALIPGAPELWRFPLRARDHVFKRGHRIMVQVQSTWFPLIDRNPQTFTPSIFDAKPSDFVKATQIIYASPEQPSRVILPIVATQ